MGSFFRSYPLFNPLRLGLIRGLAVGHSRQETLHRGQKIGGTDAGLTLTQDKRLHDAITTHGAEPTSPTTLACFLFRSAGMGRLGRARPTECLLCHSLQSPVTTSPHSEAGLIRG